MEDLALTHRGLGKDLLLNEPVRVQQLEGDRENVGAGRGGLGHPHSVAVGAGVSLGRLLAHGHGRGRPSDGAARLGGLGPMLKRRGGRGRLVHHDIIGREREDQGGRAVRQGRDGAGDRHGQHDAATGGHVARLGGGSALEGGRERHRRVQGTGAAEVAIRLIKVVRALTGGRALERGAGIVGASIGAAALFPGRVHVNEARVAVR